MFLYSFYTNTLRSPTGEQYHEDDGELVHSIAEDVLEHGAGDERLRAPVRLAVEDLLRGHLSGEGKRRQGVHDQVHPQHLDGLQRRVLHGQAKTSSHK